MTDLKKTAALILLATVFTGCSSELSSLSDLGSRDDFNGQRIDKDFESPDDESEAQKKACSGLVNTSSSRLNARVDASLNAKVCAKLESKSTVTISNEGHKNGFVRILTSKCEEPFSYASAKFISLGSDCTFTINDEEKKEKAPPVPTPPPVEKDRTPDSLVNTLYIERGSFQLANVNAKRWDGCKNGYKTKGGAFSDSRCNKAFLHQKFSENLNQEFYKCIFYAADTAGYEKTERVFIHHLGTYNNRNARNSSRKSNHAYARAMDIKNFNLVDDRGRVSRVSTLLRDYKGKQAVFYDEFRDCWKKSLPSNCRPGNTEYKGSIGHRSSKLGGNTLHNDHIHLSFPFCAG